MATQAGIGVLIGLGLGSGITAFLMKRIIRRQDNALQQSLNRLNRIQEDHSQDLTTSLAKLESDYEQQLAATIERYQDSHEAQLTELEAEYEARIAALLGANALVSEDEVAASPAAPPTPVDTTVVEPTPADDGSPPALELSQQPTNESFTSIPDPWTEAASGSAAVAPTPVAEPSPETAVPAPETEPQPQTAAATAATVGAVAATAAAAAATTVTTAAATSADTGTVDTTAATAPTAKKMSRTNDPTQIAADLGRAAAINRKQAIRAVPQLGKLVKNHDPEVRLAAVSALQESGSIKAIPFLRKALRDTDSRVVATASAALSRFKGSKKPAAKAKVTKKKRRR